jgi:lipopolysaccharide transport system permease protein
MPLSLVVSNLVRFAVQLVLFLLTMGWYYWIKGDTSFHFTYYVFLFPYIVLLMALLGLGLGMIISALTTKYRDLAFLVTFGVQLLMYLTTVIYPLSTALDKFSSLGWVIKYNPMTPIIELFRMGFLGSGTVSWELLGYSTGITFLMLVVGIVIFNRVEKSFVDTV